MKPIIVTIFRVNSHQTQVFTYYNNILKIHITYLIKTLMNQARRNMMRTLMRKHWSKSNCSYRLSYLRKSENIWRSNWKNLEKVARHNETESLHISGGY